MIWAKGLQIRLGMPADRYDLDMSLCQPSILLLTQPALNMQASFISTYITTDTHTKGFPLGLYSLFPITTKL